MRAVQHWILVFTFLIASSGPLFSQYQANSQIDELMSGHKHEEAAKLISGLIAQYNESASPEQLMYYYNELSLAELKMRNYDAALQNALLSLELSLSVSDSSLISKSWLVTSFGYNRTGQLDSALKYTNKAMLLARKQGNASVLRSALISLATISNQNKHFTDALNYYAEALIQTRQINDPLLFAVDHYNLGLTFLNLQQYDSCLYHLNTAVHQATLYDQKDLLLFCFGSMSECYLALDDHDQWMHWLLKALELARDLQNHQFLAMGSYSLAEHAMRDDNFEVALSYALDADSLLRLQPYPVMQAQTDSLLYLAYSGLHRYREAIKHLNLFYHQSNQLFNEQQAAQLNEMKVQYEVAEKNLLIKNQALDISAKKKQVWIYLLGNIFFLTLIFTVILIRWKRKKYVENIFQKEKYVEALLEEKKQLPVRHSYDAIGDIAIEAIKEISSDEEETVEITEDKKELYDEMLNLIEKRKLYLNPELNQQVMITMLGTNKKYLYQALAQNTNDNFRMVINRFRINESKRLIRNEIQKGTFNTHGDLYQRSGFNSQASFYRAFKSQTGLTPREYARECAKQGA